MNVFRRASQTVSSVASAASSVATGGIRGGFGGGNSVSVNDCTEEFVLRSAREKATIQLKVFF